MPHKLWNLVDTSTKRKHLVVILCAFLLLATYARVAISQDRPAPLSNISKVTTLVNFNATGDPPLGVSEARLRTVLELRLRSAGLRVLTMDEDKKDPNFNPYLYLNVRSLETKSQSGRTLGFAYRLDLSARAFQNIPFNRARAPLEIWVDSTMAVGSPDTAANQIEQMVNQMTDSFLNDWLAANPKK